MRDDPNQPRTGWNEAMTVIIGAACQQGFEAVYRSLTVRMVTFIALMALMFLENRLVGR